MFSISSIYSLLFRFRIYAFFDSSADRMLVVGVLLSLGDMQLSSPEGNMSDGEHHFESKADAGASKTYRQQAGTIRKNGYIVFKGRACKGTNGMSQQEALAHLTALASHSQSKMLHQSEYPSASLTTSFAEEQDEEIATLKSHNVIVSLLKALIPINGPSQVLF